VLNVCRTLSWGRRGAPRGTGERSAQRRGQPGAAEPSGALTLIEVECLGACDRAPVVMVNDDWEERLAPEKVGQLIDDIRTKGRAAFTGCHLHKEKETGGAR
jgi:NADH:ubiquinone oxidoreductase subunit E